MNAFIKFVLIISCFFSFCLQSAQLRETCPGSRSVCAINLDNHCLSMTLALRKKCECDNFPAYRDLCPCWSNISQEDQPAIQGDANTLLKYVLKPFSPIFGVDIKNEEVVCQIPGPKFFVVLAKTKGIGNYFKYFPGKELIGDLEYLKLIAKGKVPLAGFDDNFEADPMGLHLCLHDLFNHVALWSFLPDHIRNILQLRASKIVNLSFELENTFSQNSSELAIWYSVQRQAVIAFDTTMGTLNGTLFTGNMENAFLPGLSDEMQKVFLEKMKISKFYYQLEMLLNFGMAFSDVSESSIEAQTFNNPENWIWQFCNAMSSSDLKASLKEQKFHQLLALTPEQREDSRIALLIKIKELLNINGNEDDDLILIFSFYDFIRHVKEQMLMVHQRCKEHTIEWIKSVSSSNAQ